MSMKQLFENSFSFVISDLSYRQRLPEEFFYKKERKTCEMSFLKSILLYSIVFFIKLFLIRYKTLDGHFSFIAAFCLVPSVFI